MPEHALMSDIVRGSGDKGESHSAIAGFQGWVLGASHDPRPDRQRGIGADGAVPASLSVGVLAGRRSTSGGCSKAYCGSRALARTGAPFLSKLVSGARVWR
jgi:hypothetical protein